MGFSVSYTCSFCTKDNSYEQVNIIPHYDGFCSMCKEKLVREDGELKCTHCDKKGSDVSQIKCSGDLCFNIATIKWYKKSEDGDCLII